MASDEPSFFAELKRRNVWRAAALYIGAAWAISQGISQLTPALGLPDLAARWFLIACAIGFPFWIAFAWYYAITPQGIKRESEVAPGESITHSTARKLDFAIIGVLTVAVVLLATGYFVRRKAPASPAKAQAVQTITAKSIAVLPFENLSGDQDNEYFVAGMQDLILTKLADVGDLKVISRTSTAKYASHPDDLKTIGQQLGVATILEGSVQKQGNQVLINVQLIDVRTDAHIWAESYTRTLDNIFGVEGEVAGQIATALNAKLSPADAARVAAVPTTDPGPYDLFLRAEYRYSRGHINNEYADVEAAIGLYRQAVAEDPNFALAWARLSYAESDLSFNGGGGANLLQLKRQARADAERARKLQPELPAAYLAVGYNEFWGYLNYAAALKAFMAALALAPNNADALVARGSIEQAQGRFDAAITSLTRAVALDPRNVGLVLTLGDTFMMVGRYAEAERWFQRALTLEPDSPAKYRYVLAVVFGDGDIPSVLAMVQGDPRLKEADKQLLVYRRKFAEAIADVESTPDNPENFPPYDGSKAMHIAWIYWQAGDHARARALFAKALQQDRAALVNVQGAGDQTYVLGNVGFDEVGVGDTAAGLATLANFEAFLAKTQDTLDVPRGMLRTANAYVMAGRADLAVPLLEKALAAPGIGDLYSPVMLWLDPAWDPIRNDPRFQALLQKYAKYKPAVTYDVAPSSSSGRASS